MEIIGALFVALIAALILSLIGAIILRAAAKWVIKEDITFGNAYATVFIAYVVNTIIGFVLGFGAVVATHSKEAVDAMSLLMLPVGFLIQSGIIASRLKTPFGKACLISLAMIAVAIGIMMAVGVIIFIIIRLVS